MECSLSTTLSALRGKVSSRVPGRCVFPRRCRGAMSADSFVKQKARARTAPSRELRIHTSTIRFARSFYRCSGKPRQDIIAATSTGLNPLISQTGGSSGSGSSTVCDVSEKRRSGGGEPGGAGQRLAWDDGRGGLVQGGSRVNRLMSLGDFVSLELLAVRW